MLVSNEIYLTVQDWAAVNDTSSLYGGGNQQLYPENVLPRRIKNPPTRYPNKLPSGSIGIVSNGRVWGINGTVITPDNHLIWDDSLAFFNPDEIASLKKESQSAPVIQQFKNAAVVTHIHHKNYYHWMYEVLPRIHLLQKSGLKADKLIIRCDPLTLPFQRETLNHFGLKKDQLISTHHGLHIQAENLIVPSSLSSVSKWSYDFLRAAFLNQLAGSGHPRIFISRKSSRKIINETELMDILSHYGFKSIELETLSVAEQAQLFSTAEVVIAPHGAGLTNLTFCRPETKVLEIFSPTYISSLYWVISSLGNLEYHHFVGDLAEPDPQGWEGYHNIKVNLEKILRIIKKMGL